MGTDLTLLRVPPEYLGPIYAYRAFYNLSIDRPAKPKADYIETYMLMGTPKASGNFTEMHADIQITGLLLGAGDLQTYDGLDYFDFEVDVSLPGIPGNFGGVSGGGLWKVLVFRSPSTGAIDSHSTLEGVAFYQVDLEDSQIVLRCHGPQSIQAVAARTSRA